MSEPNPKQLEAIQAPIDSNVRVVAPPGSGKTFIIENRYKFLVDNGVSPDKILVVTFSKAMADEMGQRIQKTCPQANLEQVSTIHAFCYRLLTKWDGSYQGYSVPKEWEVKKAINEAVERFWKSDEVPAYKEVLHWIDNSKYHGLTIDESRAFFSQHLGTTFGNWLYQIRKEYDRWLDARKAMTFSDMLYLVEQKLKELPFRTMCQVKFPYLMLDEAQDTNYQAMRILLSIAKYTFVVGDVDQMMYRFQGAKPELITENYTENIKTILLNKNYRSTTNIIKSCQKLIKFNYSGSGGPYPQEFMKDVSGIKDEGQTISFQMLPTIEDESSMVAATVQEQIENGYKFGDFFIGARTRAQLGYLEGALTRADIKFINITGGSFWQSRHVSDVIAYLKLAHNPSDNESFKKIYNIASINNRDKRTGKYLHHRWLGQEFLRVTNESYLRVHDAPRYNKRYYYGVKDLTDFVSDIQIELKHAENTGDVIRFIIDNCYLAYMKADEGITASDEAENGKVEDLNTVMDIASKYTDIGEFLVYVDKMIKQAEDSKSGDWSEYLILSTYHRLKGLERKIMIATGLCEGYDEKTDQPRGLLPHSFSLCEPPQFGILPTGGMSPIEDERCIAFVAVSRAKELVFLTGCEKYRTWRMQPSRFVGELMGGKL